MTTISATNARIKFYDLLEEVSASGKRVAITNKGETKAVLISPEELAAWETTLEVTSDHQLMRAIKKGDADIKAGRVTAWGDLKKELGLDQNVSNNSFKSGKKRS